MRSLQVYEYSFSMNEGLGEEREVEFLCESERERYCPMPLYSDAFGTPKTRVHEAFILSSISPTDVVNFIVKFQVFEISPLCRDAWIVDLRVSAARWSRSHVNGRKLVDIVHRKKRNVASWLMSSFSQGCLFHAAEFPFLSCSH